MIRHILIRGDRGVGKSTLIQRLTCESGLPVYGFCTKTVAPDADGFHDIYIHPAATAMEDRVYEEANRIGNCSRRTHNANAEVFETLGVRYLTEIGTDGIVVMDELGFMEKDSPLFMDRVIEVLQSNAAVLAVIKNRDDIPFLNTLQALPDVETYRITAETREDLYHTLLPLVMEWKEQ